MTAKLAWEIVRDLIEEQTGPVLTAEPATEGLNSEIAVAVHTSCGATFVKGLRSDHPRVWTQHREAEINPYVLGVSPRLRWHVETDGWNLLGFELIVGRGVDYTPGSPDLPKVVRLLRRLSEIPCPAGPLKQAEQRWASYTDTPELFAGDCLLHTEWSPGNVMVNDTAHLVDWAWPTKGAAWIDPACWVIWLVASGHHPQSAQAWAARVPAWHGASLASLIKFARAQAGMWDEIAQDDPEPWTHRTAEAARQWAEHLSARTHRNRRDSSS